ncbi:MAG: mechanosensitive ion channel family protein [Xenococcaceae cyanobacterium MO_167.B52]|nr:mechanosensitive ion channel family protein [Xenococcaceae cyanobacterium MO_167.B52]
MFDYLASHFISKLTRLKRQLGQIVVWGLALLLLQTSLSAAPLVKHPLAPPDTSSPQATLISFVENINKSYQILMTAYDQYLEEPGLFPSNSVKEQVKQAEIFFERAEGCLNLSEIPPRLEQDVALEGTLLLKEVLDRIEVPTYDQIPDAEAVATDKELSRWILPHTEIDIVKVKSGPQAGKFLFSTETVARLKEFYTKVQQLPSKSSAKAGFYQFYISTPGRLFPLKGLQGLPSWLNSIYWDQTLWQLITLGISLLIAFWIPYRSFRGNWRRIVTLDCPQRTWTMLLPPIITISSLVAVRYVLAQWINITGQLLLTSLIILEIIFWMMVALTIFLFGNALAETIIASPRINPQGLDASMIRTFFSLSGLGISTFVLIVGLEQVGISLIPILAGLGIGGLALALAARPTLENIIAGLILFADRPVKVGEYCCFGEKEGTVLEIGLRSTRILELNGDIISLPNSHFSELELANHSRRDRILLRQTIGLRYETTSEQLRYLLVNLRSMLLAHPKLLQEPAEVRFIKYGDYSLDVEIFAYVDTGNRFEFRGIQEDVLLRVKDIVEASGTDFAFPSQTTYISRDSGLDQELSRAAEAEVQGWRSKGMLPFPEFSSEQQEQLRDTLDFPPKGSPNGNLASDNRNKNQGEPEN